MIFSGLSFGCSVRGGRTYIENQPDILKKYIYVLFFRIVFNLQKNWEDSIEVPMYPVPVS